MRIDIPQDLPHRRETPPQTRVPGSQEPTAVQRHLHSVKQRTAQNRPSQAPRRPLPRGRRNGARVASHSREKRDPREPVDARRTRRDRIPSQTIGVQLRPEGAERLGQGHDSQRRDIRGAVTKDPRPNKNAPSPGRSKVAR